MDIPKKFMPVPFENLNLNAEQMQDISLTVKDIQEFLRRFSERILVIDGVLSYVDMEKGNAFNQISVRSFKATANFPKRRVVQNIRDMYMSAINCYDLLRKISTEVAILGAKPSSYNKAEVTLPNGSKVRFNDHIIRRPCVVALPPVFKTTNISKHKVGDRVHCPVLAMKQNQKVPRPSTMATPILLPIKTQESNGEILFYSKTSKITRIYKKQNYARVVTPDGPRFYHLGCLMKPLEHIPYL